jgi:chromosome segregation ATPase
MKNNNGLIIGSGFAASLLAFGVTSGVITFKDASIASLLAAPAALITHIATDSKAQKAVRESDSKLSKALRELDTAKQSVGKLQDLENKVYYLNLSLDETKKALDLAVATHEKAYKLNQVMREEKGVLAGQVAAFKSEIEQLQLEIEEWEEQFSDRVELAADAKFQVAKKAEIQKIFDEHDAITSQAMQLFQELQQWGQKVAHGHSTKREIIQNLARSYNENLLEFGETVKKEHAAYVSQIEILNERVGQLQHQLNGDLIEPEYLRVAYSIEGRIANDIAREIFTTLQIPLAVKGYQAKPDGSTDVGYGV